MRTVLISALFTVAAFCQTPTPPFTYNGHTYNVTSSPIGVFLTMTGHWMYEPSMIQPSAATGNEWVMMFSTNITAGKGNVNNGQANVGVYMATSASGTVANGQPQLVLSAALTSNVCDIIDARPIWDGSLWHVYMQAAGWSGAVGSTCLNSPGPNFIVEATAPSLTQLSWVYSSGQTAAQILYCGCSSGAGIGQDFQVFNTKPYNGYPPTPYLFTYEQRVPEATFRSVRPLLALQANSSFTCRRWDSIPPRFRILPERLKTA